MMKVSVCIPVYNGAESIGPLVEEVFEYLNESYETEIVLVNDCSPDNSHEVCKELAEKHENLKYILLRRNYGEHNAVMCALNHATGDYAAIIDDDFQNPPSEIVKLLEEAEKGYDVVYSEFEKKRHSLFRNLGSKFNDKVTNWLLEKPKDLYLSSFKVLNRDMIDEITRYTGPFPYVDGLVLRATNSISSVLVEHRERAVGTSNYTLKKLVRLWLSIFINFSIKPLRLFALFGIVVTVLSFLASVAFIIEKLIFPDIQMGWTSLIVSILFFAGVQIVFLGLIGEYVGKHYLQSSGTPQWTIREKHL